MHSASRHQKPLPVGAERVRIVDARTERGSLEMFTPIEGVLLTRAIGPMDALMAEQWVRRTEHLWAAPGRLAIS